MSKELKTLMTDFLRDRFADIDEACVVDITALTVGETQKVRGTLREKNMHVRVIKNSMARRAFCGGPLELLGNGLSGPCALVTGGDSIIDAARTMVDLRKEFPKIELKIGVLSGDLELTSVAELAKLKGKIELIGEIAMLASSPGRSIAGCLSSPGGKIAGCLKTLADKEEN